MITHSCTLVYLYCYCSSRWLCMWFCSLKLMLHMKQVGQALLLFYIYIIIVILCGYHVALRVAISHMMLVSRIIAITIIRLSYLFVVLYVCYAFLWLISWVLFLHHTRFLGEFLLSISFLWLASWVLFLHTHLCGSFLLIHSLCVFLFLFRWSAHLLRCVDVPIAEAQQDFIRDWR